MQPPHTPPVDSGVTGMQPPLRGQWVWGCRPHTHPLQTAGSQGCTPHPPPWAVGSRGYPWVQPHEEVPASGTRRLHPSPGPGGPVRLSRALGECVLGAAGTQLSMGPLLPLATSDGSHGGPGGHMKHCGQPGDKDALWGRGEPGRGRRCPPWDGRFGWLRLDGALTSIPHGAGGPKATPLQGFGAGERHPQVTGASF